MTQQMKPYFRETCVATCLAIAALLVSGGATAARPCGAKDSARGIRTTAGSTRSSASKPGGRSLSEESREVGALGRKRDPFKVPPAPLPGGRDEELSGPLPPGVRGLVISQLKLEGIVREDASNTMIAVVTGRTSLAYFLRVHDKLFNGVVSAITPDSIRFVENRLDTSSRAGTREVVLKLGSER